MVHLLLACDAHGAAPLSPAPERVPERLDDAKLGLPPSWQGCRTDADCQLIFHGCGGHAAANRRHLGEARAQAFERGGGNPATLNCVQGAEGPIEALCRRGSCGAYHYPAGFEPKSKK